jgi:hypothetical protein
MENNIKILLREALLNEEYAEGKLYGYHVTSMSNLESIKQNGLNVGQRSMQGKGLYGFYDYNHAFRYAGKGEINEPIIIKFYITSPNRFLYLNMDIAKDVLGNDYDLISQINNYFYGGFDEFFNQVKAANPSMTEEKLKNILQNIQDDNTEDNQRKFVFSLIPADLNNKLNVVWNGNYGLEFRIANTRYVKVVGYDVPNFYGKDTETNKVSFIDKIPNTEEFEPLLKFLENNKELNTYDEIQDKVKSLMDNIRNSREFYYYNSIIELLDKI